MKKILFILAVATMVGCQEGLIENRSDCEINEYGFMDFICTSANPYDVYIDNVVAFRVAPNSQVEDFQIQEGQRRLKAEQVSGFIFFPTIVESTYYVDECGDYFFQFP